MSWDVVVVGAGPSGSLVAERLRSRGLHVALLDAGPHPRRQLSPPEVDRRAWSFRTVGGSFDWYRVRAVGGRALLWGGWSYRLSAAAVRRAGVPFDARELARYYAQVEQRLGVREGRLDARLAEAARALEVNIVPRRMAVGRDGGAWTPVSPRAALSPRTLAAALRLQHAAHQAEAVEYLDLRTGVARRVGTRAVVLAASPIETARLLLESELGAAGAGVGRGLVDHMVASYLLLEPRSVHARAGGNALNSGGLVEPFVNIDERSRRDYPGSFSIELSGPVSLEALGVERMVPESDVERWSATQIHALGELFPEPMRYVSLDPERRDALGRREPIIHVAHSDAERRLAADMKAACLSVADVLATPGSKLIPFLDPLQLGAGHEAGTCAMGFDERSVCDPHGRLRALQNVWVADASALPTSTDRHPTLTVLAHALRTADGVVAALSSTPGTKRVA